MRSLEARMSNPTLARWVLPAGLVLLALGCSQSEASDPLPQRRAAATSALSPSQAVRDELATFAENVSRKLDRSRGPTSVALPEGGVLNVPNGHVAHASILVRGPDGRLRSACVSTPAEVSALVNQVRTGAGQ